MEKLRSWPDHKNAAPSLLARRLAAALEFQMSARWLSAFLHGRHDNTLT